MPMSFVILTSIPIKLVRVCHADPLRKKVILARLHLTLSLSRVQVRNTVNYQRRRECLESVKKSNAGKAAWALPP